MTMTSRTAFLESTIDRLNTMKRILGLLRFGGREWLDGVYATFKFRVTLGRFRPSVARPRKQWFSTVREREFRGRELERRAFIESTARLPVAR